MWVFYWGKNDEIIIIDNNDTEYEAQGFNF